MDGDSMVAPMVQLEQKWTGANLKKRKDKIRRWSRVTIEGKGDQLLTIYSMYRVNANKIDTAGGDAVWMQEYKHLLHNGIKDPNPRQQVLLNLEAEIQHFKTNPSACLCQ